MVLVFIWWFAGYGWKFVCLFQFQMFRFKVYGVKLSATQPCVWVPAIYIFGHQDMKACEMWVKEINSFIKKQEERPKSLMVSVLY